MNNDHNDNYPTLPKSANMDNYLQSIKDAIYQVTQEKLLKQLSMTIQGYQDASKDNLKDMMRLLQAMKPFVHQKAADNIEQLSEIFSDIKDLKLFVNHHIEDEKVADDNTTENNKKKIVDRQGDLIIEDNTVYEIDETCKPEITAQSMSQNKGNIYAMLLLLLGVTPK